MPSCNASLNTAASGISRKMPRKSSATPVISTRSHGGSVVACRRSVAGVAGCAKLTRPLINRSISPSSESIVSSAPFLQQVDQQQQRERKQQHRQRNRCRTLIIEFLELGHNQQRH